jgi:hypothetical protein
MNDTGFHLALSWILRNLMHSGFTVQILSPIFKHSRRFCSFTIFHHWAKNTHRSRNLLLMTSITEPPPSSSPQPCQHDVVKLSPLPQLSEADSDSRPASTIPDPIDEKHHSTSPLFYSEEIEGPLLKKRHGRVFRHLRYTFFNVYRRLFTIVFILNMIGVVVLVIRYRKSTTSPALLADLANIASANVMVALLIRQDYVVNALFK